MREKEILHSIDDYVNCISQVNSFRKNKKGKKKKIIVHKLEQSDFKDFDLAELLIKRNIDSDREQFSWQSIHHMQFRKGSMSMWFKYESFEMGKEFREVDLCRRGKCIGDITKHELLPLYHEEIKIKGNKYNDLMEQLKFIPPVYHQFYKDLRSCKCKKKCECE